MNTKGHERRERLKAIIAPLGETATPAEIREEAYRAGFGVVNAGMLVAVRNALWPDRPKVKRGGDPRFVHDPRVVALITCPNCGSIATRAKQSRKLNGLFRRTHTCGDCGRVYKTVSAVVIGGKSGRAQRIAESISEKACTKCHQTLPVSDFGKRTGRTGSRNFYTSACRKCLNEARADAGFRETLNTHGLTLHAYNAVLTSQGGVCAICRSPGKGKGERYYPLCFDHCHKTGKFRGLLCDRCNLGIGNFDDDIDRMTAAVEYIRRNETGDA